MIPYTLLSYEKNSNNYADEFGEPEFYTNMIYDSTNKIDDFIYIIGSNLLYTYEYFLNHNINNYDKFTNLIGRWGLSKEPILVKYYINNEWYTYDVEKNKTEIFDLVEYLRESVNFPERIKIDSLDTYNIVKKSIQKTIEDKKAIQKNKTENRINISRWWW